MKYIEIDLNRQGEVIIHCTRKATTIGGSFIIAFNYSFTLLSPQHRSNKLFILLFCKISHYASLILKSRIPQPQWIP